MKTKVLVTGVFDGLHHEHRLFLQKAAALGDELIVGIESDARVRNLKGEGRPIFSEEQRAAAVMEMGLASEVLILPEEFSRPGEHEALIAQLRPNFLAVSENTSHLEKKQAILEKYGGEVVVVHPHNPAISTTKILAAQAAKS